jgi:hypothetical protein
MNRIDIQIEEFEVEEWVNRRGWAAVIYIDRKPVAEFLKQFEPSICSSPQSRSPYGRWIGISPVDVLPPSRSFLGTPDEKFSDFAGRVPVCACSECGMYWCDGIWTRVLVSETKIVWTDFIANPEINPVRLDAVPRLEFDPQQYRDAFSVIPNAEQDVPPYT